MNPMPATLQQRLRRIMTATGWSQADLARESGAAKQTVSDWLSDGYTQIDARFAYRLEDRSGFSAKWLLLGHRAGYGHRLCKADHPPA